MRPDATDHAFPTTPSLVLFEQSIWSRLRRSQNASILAVDVAFSPLANPRRMPPAFPFVPGARQHGYPAPGFQPQAYVPQGPPRPPALPQYTYYQTHDAHAQFQQPPMQHYPQGVHAQQQPPQMHYPQQQPPQAQYPQDTHARQQLPQGHYPHGTHAQQQQPQTHSHYGQQYMLQPHRPSFVPPRMPHPPSFYGGPFATAQPYQAAPPDPCAGVPTSASEFIHAIGPIPKVFTLNTTAWKDADKLSLERDNWREFASKVENQLGMVAGAIRFLITDPEDPNVCPTWQMYPAHHRAWMDSNSIMLAFLRDVLTVTERTQITHCKLASDAWDILCYRHLVRGPAGQIAALKRFANISNASDPKTFSATTTLLTQSNEAIWQCGPPNPELFPLPPTSHSPTRSTPSGPMYFRPARIRCMTWSLGSL
ncbi:hypothetical protein B0H10DRAFT_2244705 [Mycena sp. CBHHK59/15]|nr:hypothetical protein B0H10DRAFT_2244705 [Mycena sp. CBHHK59/15]